MTTKEIVQWVDAVSKISLERKKETAVLLNGQAMQLVTGVGGMFDKKSKFLNLEKLYPALFGKEKDQKPLSPEEHQRQEVMAWRAFLGV